MKKFFALTLAFLMLVMLCSCMTPSITITRGTVNGDVYTNDVLGFEFTKPSSWTYSTDEEIAEDAIIITSQAEGVLYLGYYAAE